MNPLKVEIDDFFKIASFESLHYQTKTHLTYRIRDVKKQIETHNGLAPHIGTSLIIGDLTGKSENGWKLNYPTGFQTEIKRDQMIESIDKLISFNGMTYLANCYEVLESFLFNIVGEFLNMYPSYQKILNPKSQKITDKKESLRKYYRSKNNKDLLKLLRQISKEFENSEKENNSGMNLNDWYYVISNVRHSIVHSLYFIDTKKLSFNRHQMDIFNTFFSNEKSDKITKLVMSENESKKQINLLGEFVFLIFKSLCITENENWEIFKNMNK